ncbi:LysR substrate-binding domain-containing protein [Rhizobium mayense]|uniref:LysR substrate-binding domain-containing protein n=1 Tax=Rhizobium mayense TaxID=1312184 RepID=A0ABT7K1I1_9HYPH|nr:LysR substrate-binding domain-containing protein [Rhizobium mayense]MDL2402465.1 LysR substrate-binding domain-containing protein [Rhizobium mayense]
MNGLANLSGLSLRDLEYVVAVAEYGSFVKAAEACGVSQPSLSGQIRKLESWVGVTIFERTTRRVIVTTEGQKFLGQARIVLNEARSLLAIARRGQAPFGGSLRLAAIATLGPYLFPRILGAFKNEFPELKLILGEGLTDDLVERLIGGELDAVLLSLPLEQRALTVMPLFVEPFLLASPEAHPASLPGGPAWEALGGTERLLLGEGHCLREQALAACSSPESATRHATSLETLKYMVAAGEGCTLVPTLARGNGEFIHYTPLPDRRYSRTIGLAWRRSDPRDDDFRGLALGLKKISLALDPNLQPT